MAAALLVLVVVGVQDIVLALGDFPKGEESGIHGCSLDLIGVLLDNWKRLVNLLQAAVGEGVRLSDIWRHHRVGTLEVWDDWLREGGITMIGDVKGLLTVR